MIGNEKILQSMPDHLQTWMRLARILPIILMAAFTLAVFFSGGRSPSLIYLESLGISHREFGVGCLISTIYTLVMTRKLNFQSVIHYALGTMPIVVFLLLSVFLLFSGRSPATSVVIYLFTYVSLTLMYWLAIALAEWESLLKSYELVE